MFTDITTLIDIKDFQKALNTSFKGILTTFKNQVIQAPKKNMSANKAVIDKEAKEDTPERTKQFKAEFLKKKASGKADKEFQQGAAAIASKLCDDSNQNRVLELSVYQLLHQAKDQQRAQYENSIRGKMPKEKTHIF